MESVVASTRTCRACGLTIPFGESVVVGDTMRFSVRLVRQFRAMPNGESPFVRLSRIVVEEDGSKTLWLENVKVAKP
jgi:hypothetical protein